MHRIRGQFLIHRRWGSLWIVAVLAGLLSGCGGTTETPRTVIRGTVTCDNSPVPTGEVRFVRLDVDASGPAPSIPTAAIVDGQYRVESFGGVPHGQYRVEVDALRKTGRQVSKNVGTEMAMQDETEPVGQHRYAGAESPLNLTVEAGTSQFDISIPP